MKRSMVLVALLALLAACTTPTEPPAPRPDAAQSTVAASRATAVSGEVVRITVQLMDAAGEPLARADEPVAFYSTSGTLGSAAADVAPANVGPLVTLTNGSGAAAANLTSGPGTVTVTAYLGEDDDGEKIGEVVVTFSAQDDPDDDPGDGSGDGSGDGTGEEPGDEPQAPDAAASTLLASSAKAATGGSVRLTVQLHDASGEPVARADQDVTFVTVGGRLAADGAELGDVDEPLTIATDDAGTAVALLSSDADGAVTVSAHLGEDADAPAIGALTVTFASVSLEDLVVAYDGEPKTLTAAFSDPAAAEDAVYEYMVAGTEETLAGAPVDAGVYTVTVTAGGGFPGTATATLTIAPRVVAFAGEVAFADKAYDATPLAAVTASLDPASLVAGDDVGLDEAMAGEFQVLEGEEWLPSSRAGAYGAEAGTRVVAALALVGEDAGNYALPEQPVGAASIAPLPVAVAEASADDKPYDGTTAVAFTGTIEPAPFEGDGVALAGAFSTADAGEAVPVLVTLVGEDAANYALQDPELSAAITPLPLTVTAGDATKTYGDEADLASAGFTAVGLLEGQSIASVSLASAGSAADADAGSYDIVASAAVPAPGTDLANYQVTYAPGTLTVAPRTLTVTPDPGQGKTYGEADPALAYGVDGLVGEDSLTGALGRAAGEDVGEYAYTLGDLAVDDGNEGANYSLTLGGEATFGIAARQLVVTPLAEQGKTYGDPDLGYAFDVTEGSLVGDDAFVGALGREAGDAVGTYAYTLGDLSVNDGNDGANYALSLGGSESFAITARTVTVGGSFTVATRPYDGTVAATVASNDLMVVNAVEGDDVAVAPVAVFSDALVGSGKAVTLTGDTTLVGGAAGNYLLDMTDAPASTGEIARAPVTFDVANKNLLTYTGRVLPLVIVADIEPVPGDQPVAYSINYSRVATPAGDAVDQGVSGIKEAGLYRVTITSLDARYVGQNDVLVPVSTRPIVVSPAVDAKVYGEDDPDLSPVLVSGTLAAGHSLAGRLAYAGEDAGTYELTLGTVAVMAGATDETANYAVAIAGAFTVQSAPVSFDIGNADDDRDGVHVFFGDGSFPLGLEILSTPAGMYDYELAYRRTHDEDHEPVPTGRQTVSAIQALGTYEVTISSRNPNYAGTSVRTVWLTDGIRLAAPELGEGGEPLPVEAALGRLVNVTVPFVGADGAPRALGPVPVTFDLAVTPSAGLELRDPLTGEPITAVTAAPGATSLTFQVLADALQETPYQVSLSLADWDEYPDPLLDVAVQPVADLVVLGDGLEVGQDAVSAPLTVQLQDADGLPVVSPVPVTLDLAAEDLTFLSAAGEDAVTSVTIPAGASSAQFRVASSTVGTHAFTVEDASGLPAVPDSYAGSVTVNPKPTFDSLDVTSAQVGDTLTIVVSGGEFAAGATVTFGGVGLQVVSSSVDDAGRITLVLAVGTDASVGAHDLVITNPDGGTVTVSGAIEVTKPVLTAADDGPFGLVEGGSTQVAIADLLANDSYGSGTLTWGFGGVVSTHEVSVADNGTTLTVNSTGLREDGAWLVYRVVDELGTEATATVAFDVTLPPVDAIVFDDADEFEAFISAGYELPTFGEIFATWPRASSNTYFADPSTATGSAANWQYNSSLDRVIQPDNTTTHEVILSPPSEALEYFTFEATLYSTDTDDDSIGLVIAFVNDGGSLKYLVAQRTQGGNDPRQGWGITYFENGVPKANLTNVSVGGTATSGGWGGRSSRVKVVRNGDVIRAWATPWDQLTDFQGEMVIDLDANTVNGVAVPASVDLSVFKGERQYGYYTYSQKNSTYLDIAFEGGVARDVAILLTGGSDGDTDGRNDTWTGSEVWRFSEGAWSLQAGRTIQDELGYPRTVTSVAPYPAPDGEPVGTRYEVREAEVVLLPLP